MKITLVELKKEISNDLKKVNHIIEEALLETTNKTLSKIYTHVLKSNGKQIRASLVIFISKLNQSTNMENCYKLAAGIELIHLASLIHDDIIDNATVRRNQTTVHKEFSTNNAIISGVHCYAIALKLITSLKNTAILDVISDAVIDLCEGECFQVNNRHNFSLEKSDYWTIIDKKTSSLFKAACITSGILSKQSPKIIENLSSLGSSIGDIFQLVDDYLDLFDTENKLSKKIMQDLETGDISLPILLASNNTKNNSINEIKDVLKNRKKEIALSIQKEISSKKESATDFINELPTTIQTKQLKSILFLITQRALKSV